MNPATDYKDPAPSEHATPQPYSSQIDKDVDTDANADSDDKSVVAKETSTTGEPLSELPASSPDQPDNPPPYSIHSLWGKRMIVLGASLSAFFSPLTAQIYLPALTVLADDFNVTSAKINLTVTTYMVFQGITPSVIGGLADTAGRRPAYIICFIIYIAANIGLALAPNYAALMVLRCLQSAGSSTTVALCQAVVADIITSAERGQYIGITVLPIVLAPSLGPVIGGLLSQYVGWRWIFWFLTIIASVDLVALLLFFPETCRRIVGDGSVRAHPIYRTCWQMIQDWRRHRAEGKARKTGSALQRTTTETSSRAPVKFTFTPPNVFGSLMLLFEKELGILLTFSGISFSTFYAIASGMPTQFQALYGFDEITIGLMYLPMAGGSIVAGFVMGRLINNNFFRHAKKLGLSVDNSRQIDLSNFPIERARLEVGLPLLALSAAVVVAWGWALEYKASVAVPCVLLFLMGVGMIGFNNCSNTLIIDVYPGKAGAAVAANNLTRCLIGAAASAVIVPMTNAWGPGWAYTFFGLLCFALSPSLLLIMKYGVQWRKELRDKEEQKRKRKEEREAGKKKQDVPEEEQAVANEKNENGGPREETFHPVTPGSK